MIKSSILSFVFIGISTLIFGQITPSSCNAPDSIIQRYQEDADRLALRKVFNDSLQYRDSTAIPSGLSDTILDALIAVYNLNGLSERDTVVDRFEVHTFGLPTVHELVLEADSGLPWMKQLKQGNFPTGSSIFDSLIAQYKLTLDRYYEFHGWRTHSVRFISDSSYNITALGKVFMQLQGVERAGLDGLAGDGNDISCTITSNHVELIYSIGWGDCPAGCIHRRYWKFRVDYNCSVEFVESYGASINISVNDPYSGDKLKVWPMPFHDYIRVNGVENEAAYALYNLLGEKVVEGRLIDGRITALDWLLRGAYILEIQTGGSPIMKKLIKD